MLKEHYNRWLPLQWKPVYFFDILLPLLYQAILYKNQPKHIKSKPSVKNQAFIGTTCIIIITPNMAKTTPIIFFKPPLVKCLLNRYFLYLFIYSPLIRLLLYNILFYKECCKKSQQLLTFLLP